MSYVEYIVDAGGAPITVGARVRAYDGEAPGTVMEVTDPDGDVDEYGRSIAIPPRIYVKWDDDDRDWSTLDYPTKWKEGWSTSLTYRNGYPGQFEEVDWTCDDLLVVPNVGNEPQTKE